MTAPAASPDQARTALSVRGLRVLCLTSDPEASITEIRLGQPLRAWCARHAASLRVLDRRCVRQADVEQCDLLIVQRDVTAHLLALMRHAAQAGKALVFEIDDLLTEPPDFLLHARSARQKRQLVQALRLVDAVSTSTAPLRQAWLPLNPCVHITPNCGVPAAGRTEAAQSGGDARPTVLLASSDEMMLHFVAPALQSLQADASVPPFDLMAIGPCGPHLRAMGLALRELPRLPLQKFLGFIRSQPRPIALLPLDRSRFSQCKSAVKFFDYALAGAACIATDTLPYSAVMRHRVNGLVVGDRPQDWRQALAELLHDDALRARLAEQARRDVQAGHAPELSLAAWDGLMREALQRAGQRPRKHGVWPHLMARGFWLGHALAAALGAGNRRRLARRRARHEGPSTAPDTT